MKQIQMLDLFAEYEYMKAEIDIALKKCLEHQKWILGPEVKELEEKIAGHLGVKHCIGVSSGTEALVLSLRALAIKTKGQEYFSKEDLIITTPFTFTATGDAILRSGATPVFVDIDPATYNIDPARIREYLTESSKLKAFASGEPARGGQSSNKVVGIIPVHLYGQSCDMDRIMQIAKEYNLFVVEDVAQAFGGSWQGKKLGSIGNAGAFSFFPSKNLGGFGDGGMISTDGDETAELVRMLLKHGGKDKYNVDHIGYNARLDTLQAAVLLAKFKYIDEFNEKRRRIAELYNQGLQSVDGLILPSEGQSSKVKAQSYQVCHQYTIRTSKRDALQKYLKEKGISTMVYYPFPLNKMKVFEGRSIIHGGLENSEKACDEVLSLPVEPLMSRENTDLIISSVKSYFK